MNGRKAPWVVGPRLRTAGCVPRVAGLPWRSHCNGWIRGGTVMGGPHVGNGVAGVVLLLASVVPGMGAEVEAVPEIRPGILAGYLEPASRPDSTVLVPPPPAPGSQAEALDLAVSARVSTLRDGPRWRLAAQDAELHFPEAAGAFACALGFAVERAHTPRLHRLLRRILADAGLATYGAKRRYARQRPFLRNGAPICTPESRAELAEDGSYPSGHAAVGWAWALVLAELVPDRADRILARGRAFGQSRVVCNVHWQSDVVEGLVVGAAVVARLHADADFRRDLEAARRELASVAAPPPDRAQCEREVAALAVASGAPWPAFR